MNRLRFTFRPNPQNPDHMAAWELLQSVPEGQRGSFLAQAILKTREETVLEGTLRKVLREELAGLSLQQSKPPTPPAEKEVIVFGNAPPVPADEAPIPAEMMGFLSNLMRED